MGFVFCSSISPPPMTRSLVIGVLLLASMTPCSAKWDWLDRQSDRIKNYYEYKDEELDSIQCCSNPESGNQSDRCMGDLKTITGKDGGTKYKAHHHCICGAALCNNKVKHYKGTDPVHGVINGWRCDTHATSKKLFKLEMKGAMHEKKVDQWGCLIDDGRRRLLSLL